MRQKEKEEKEKDSKYRTNRGTPNDLGSYFKNRKILVVFFSVLIKTEFIILPTA